MRRFAVLVFVFCAACVLSLREAQAEALRLALNWKPEPQFGGFYAAEPHFLKRKLDVKILPGGSGTPTAQMLAAGQAEYAIVSADELILAWDRGSREMVAIYAAFQTNPQGLMFRENKNYDSISELLKDKDSTLLWQAGLPYALYLQKKFGKPAAKTAPYAGGITNFLNDPRINQQCFVTSEPLAARKAKVAVKSFLVADAGYNPYTTVLVTTKARLRDHAAEVSAMVEAVRAGWSDYVKDPSTTNQRLTKLNPAMDLTTMNESAEAQRDLVNPPPPHQVPLGQMSENRWQMLAEQLKELKLVKQDVPVKDLFRADLIPVSATGSPSR